MNIFWRNAAQVRHGPNEGWDGPASQPANKYSQANVNWCLSHRERRKDPHQEPSNSQGWRPAGAFPGGHTGGAGVGTESHFQTGSWNTLASEGDRKEMLPREAGTAGTWTSNTQGENCRSHKAPSQVKWMPKFKKDAASWTATPCHTPMVDFSEDAERLSLYPVNALAQYWI